MIYTLPDLKLVPQPAWETQRLSWLNLAEECLYGHAPQDTPVRAEIIDAESLWSGRGRRETVRIAYGPGFAWSFDAVLYVPTAPGHHPAIIWTQFSGHD